MTQRPPITHPDLLDTATVLIINAGSSSLKVKVLPQNHSFLIERIGQTPVGNSSLGEMDVSAVASHEDALLCCLQKLSEVLALSDIKAVGHRVVHGGKAANAQLIDDALIAHIEALVPFAPLHNPAHLEGIRVARRLLPDVAHVAVFDTSFHQTLPEKAHVYGLPYELYEQEGVRVYGFHGTSHDYVSRKAAQALNTPREHLKIVSLHLGNGSSAAAIMNGRSVDTSMGLTPLDGLLMGTRSGSIDPGALLYLLRQGYTTETLDALLNKQSGLNGVSGVSNDMRDLRNAANEGNHRAKLALDIFCYRIQKTIGAYAAAMSGLDLIIFTAGIGENDAHTRAQSLKPLRFLGVHIDETKNMTHQQTISTNNSPVTVMVIPTNEEKMIATETRVVGLGAVMQVG